jgi:hypothetical protein
MWTRKLQSSSQTTWAKPTTSVPHLARQRSTRTLLNMRAANLDIQVMAAVAAVANPKRIYSALKIR